MKVFKLHYLICAACALLQSCVTCQNLHQVGLNEETREALKKTHTHERFHYMGNDPSKFVEYRQIGNEIVDHWKHVRERAKDNFIYALMSNNAYGDGEDPQYKKILGWQRGERYHSCSDLEFDIYYTPNKQSPKEIVVAYRGTQGFRDWYAANLSLIPSRQTKEALVHIRKLQKKYPNAEITTTGHSLGGGLALMVSLQVDKVNAVVFDASPRVYAGIADRYPNNQRVYFRERGEFLSLFSSWYLKLAMGKHLQQTRFNFMDFNWYWKDPFGSIPLFQEHSMYRFSRGLLICAAAKRDEKSELCEYARRIYRANIGSLADE